MRVLVASTIVPFIEGGGTFIVDWLGLTLKEYGYEVDIIKLPFTSHYKVMQEQMLSLRLLDIADRADKLITIRTPSYLLKHQNKTLWFIHHHRGAYDLWGSKYQDIPNTLEGQAIREYIIRADDLAFREAKKIYTNSKIVSERLKKYNGVDSSVLYPPLINPERFYCNGYNDYIFYPSRICTHKRQDLAIKAMKYTKTDVKLIIAGKFESDIYANEVKSFIQRNKLSHKIELIDRWITEEEKINLFSNALAAAYIPYDEDSYGYPSLEASHSKKAIVTCRDSGGTLELIEDGYNGYITEPDPKMLAETFDKLYKDKSKTQKMGENALARLENININWEHVVRRLTE